MNLNPKTVRRVFVLIAGAGLIVVLVATLYVVRQRQIARKYRAYRDAGMAAFAAGDYAASLNQLKHYIRRDRLDPDALFAYATSRSRVEEPGGKHLSEGIRAFQMLAELEPDSPRVRNALLEQYTRANYNTEAIELAERVLADDPDHVGALRAKAVALDRLRRFNEAVVVAERLNEVAPTDLDGQLLTYRLYQRTQKPAAQIIARAEAMCAAHPQDPRFELLLAIAYGDSGDAKRGRKLLRTAAQRTPPDAQFVGRLAALLDSNRMFEESRALLERAAGGERPDPQVLAILVQRLWQNGQAAAAAERLKHVDPADASSDSRLLAFRALALLDMGRRSEAQPILDALAARTSDGAAVAWATALSTRFADEQPEPRAAIAKYQAALTRDPENGVIRYLVGEAYERLGESEPALAAWRASAALVPSWAKPYEKMARALAATGRTGEALQHARLAHQTAPQQPSAAVTYAVVAFQHLGDTADGARVDELLRLVESIQRVQPGEPETLPIHAALLARKGDRDAAIGVIRGAIKSQKRPPSLTLVQLAAVSRREKLGVEHEMMAALRESGEPLTPALVLARAGELAAAGKATDGLALLENAARQAAAADHPPVEWKLAIAQFRERTGDAKAAEQWLALGEAHPQDITVQTTILKRAASARGNRPFIERTIDRVKQLTGEEGTLWKIERARWLLGSGREKDHSDAVNILGDLVRGSPTLVEPRLLLAAALEKVDNVSGAIKELRMAAELEPRSAAIATELSRLLQSQGKFEDARVYLERVAKQDGLDAATRRQVAAMFAQQGAPDRAIELLRGASEQDGLDVASELLLAELYRRQGRAGEAQAVYGKLLARPAQAPPPDVIQSAADFYATQGNIDEARAVLQRLDDPAVPAAARELVRAAFAERHESPDAAASHFAAATKAAPNDPTVWRERITYLMRSGRAKEAVAVADEGLAALPDDATLAGLKVYATTAVRAAQGETDLQPLIDDLSKDPVNARAVATNQLLQDEASGRLTKQDAAARFRQLADRYPRHKPLQVEAVRRSMSIGDTLGAAELASRTMRAFPSAADVAQLATGVYRQLGDWKQMELAANEWRQRSLERPQDADVAIAEARVGAGDAGGAVKQLAPHVAAASTDPDKHAALLVTYARALAAGGRDGEARALLEPLLTRSAMWRGAWLSVASNNVKGAGAATAWLEHVTPLVPADADADADAEQVALAGAWHTIAARWNQPRALEAAKQILDPLAQQPEPHADVLMLLASIAESSGQPAVAEAHYRRALKIKPDAPAALNNLAYLLLTRAQDETVGNDEEAHEARMLAEKAVQLAPSRSTFHDTLARAHAKANDHSAALKSFERALELDSGNVEAMIGKATVLAGMGERERLRALLQQIDAALARKPSLSNELKRELEMARNNASARLETH